MAKDRANGGFEQGVRSDADPGPMVSVPASLLDSLKARLDMLELAERTRQELAQNPHALLLDEAYTRWKAEVSRPASVRTQEMADKQYGTAEPRFKVRLDSSTEDGKPGPRTEEHFPLEISANSDLEARGRYEQLMGIRKHDYTIKVEPAAALAS